MTSVSSDVLKDLAPTGKIRAAINYGNGVLVAGLGSVTDPLTPIRGCPFLSRCPEGEPQLCGQSMPSLTRLGPDHYAACYKRGSVPESEA